MAMLDHVDRKGLGMPQPVSRLIYMKSPSSAWSNRANDFSKHRNTFLSGMAQNGNMTAEVALIAPIVRSRPEMLDVWVDIA